MSSEPRAILYPAATEPVKVRLADLEVTAGFDAVDLPFVELLKDMLEKGIGEAFGQLFFSQSRVEQTPAPWSRVFVGLRYAPASSNPRPRGGSPKPQHLSPFELAAFSFCSRPDRVPLTGAHLDTATVG